MKELQAEQKKTIFKNQKMFFAFEKSFLIQEQVWGTLGTGLQSQVFMAGHKVWGIMETITWMYELKLF